MFPMLCQNYIMYCAKDIIYQFEKNPVIGWIKYDDEKREFMGITQCADTYVKKLQLPFAYDNSYTSCENLKNEDVTSFFDLLKERSFLGIFAYTLHSILWFYDYYGKEIDTENTNIFSICICGKDAKHIKWVANLLSNVLLVDIHHPCRINPNARLSCSSINAQKAVCWKYRCIPLLVTHKKDIIPKTAKIVNECHQNRATGKIYFFPVYLSTRAMNADEIIDFPIDNMVFTDNFPQLKAVCNTFLHSYIDCLADISANDSADNSMLFVAIDNIYENMLAFYKQQDDIDYDAKKPELMLRIAIGAFCHYLRNKTPFVKEANEMEANAEAFFLSDIIDNKKTESADINTIFYHLAEYIHYCLEQNNALSICVSQEKNGDDCYYLDYETFYPDYIQFLTKNKFPVPPKMELCKLLKASNLLIMRTNGKQYGMDRVINYNGTKSKRKVIIIKKNAFDTLVEDMR